MDAGQSGGLDPGGESTGDVAVPGELAVCGVVAAYPIQGERLVRFNAQLAEGVAAAFDAVDRGRWEVSSQLRMLRSHWQVSTGRIFFPWLPAMSILGLPGSGF